MVGCDSKGGCLLELNNTNKGKFLPLVNSTNTTNRTMKTVTEAISAYAAEFRRLARSTQKAHARKARAFIAQNPGCADNSNYWRGLSARQVISTASVAEGIKAAACWN